MNSTIVLNELTIKRPIQFSNVLKIAVSNANEQIITIIITMIKLCGKMATYTPLLGKSSNKKYTLTRPMVCSNGLVY
jgi:hypothetical protein